MTYTNPRDHLLHILIAFFKGVKPRPTWRVIVDALRSPAVDLPALAKRVEAAHFPDPTSTRDVVPETTTGMTPLTMTGLTLSLILAAVSVASTTTDTSGDVVKSKTPPLSSGKRNTSTYTHNVALAIDPG